MRRLLARLVRRPLVQFVLIGAAIFGFHQWTAAGRGGSPSEIRVGEAELRWLHQTWRGQFGHAPNASEMRSAVNGYIQEEMRYREGLALGLDRDDTIVRRRLAQKYDFLLGAQAAAAEPTKAELDAYYKEHPERYATPPRIQFCQAYFGSRVSGLRNAEAALAALPPGRIGDPQALAGNSGDLPFPRCREGAVRDEIAQDFGTFFADVVGRLEVGSWQGPVESGYGYHLVLPQRRTKGDVRPFEEVRSQVEEDWREANLEAARAREEDALRARYRVIVDEPALKRIVGAGSP